MDYNINFQVAALIIVALLLHHFLTQKKLHNANNTIIDITDYTVIKLQRGCRVRIRSARALLPRAAAAVFNTENF